MKAELERTQSLSEAIQLLFGRSITGRTNLLDEIMPKEVALAYDELGSQARIGTYRKIAKDFLNRTFPSSKNKPRILDLACGSGLLSLELADDVAGEIVGIDLSEYMIQLAHVNQGKSNPHLTFQVGSVYNLPQNHFSSIVCRNALHRFHDPRSAIQKMYESTQVEGKIYLRDLRRDANWGTIITRIGEQRWQRPVLIQDYIGAMAAMLTIEELEQILQDLNISDYSVTNGSYIINPRLNCPSMNEFAKEVEYVCVISK